MRTRAAVLAATDADWDIVELELAPPREHEVLLQVAYSGLCRSDEHLRHGNLGGRYPLVGGHEGTAVVAEVGLGVTGLSPGDHVVTSFVPACGRCRYCASGRSNFCDLGATIATGELPGGGFRFSSNSFAGGAGGRAEFGGFCMLGTFSQYTVVSEYSCVKIEPHIPLDIATLVSCGVPTGWGSAVYAGGVGPGDTVVVFGAGGIGINAVQGAAFAGASHVIVVEPVAFKRELALKLGATAAVESADEAAQLARQGARAMGADVTIVTTGALTAADVTAAFRATSKGGTIVVTALADDPRERNVSLMGTLLTSFGIRVQGALFGSCNPRFDIPNLLRLWEEGTLNLSDLISARYPLEDIRQGYRDQAAGRLIRGLIDHQAGSQTRLLQ